MDTKSIKERDEYFEDLGKDEVVKKNLVKAFENSEPDIAKELRKYEWKVIKGINYTKDRLILSFTDGRHIEIHWNDPGKEIQTY